MVGGRQCAVPPASDLNFRTMTKFLDIKGAERVISKLKTLIAGKADKSHTHTKSQISDFPKSLPASDVAAWAKAATKPGYSWGEISSKPSTFAPSSHTHSYIVREGDYRNVATTPNDYYNKLIFAGIKISSTIGSPTTNTYAYLVGLRGYGDSSGGNSHEIAFYNGGISHRDGASTSWGSWKQLIDSGNIGSQSVKYATTAGTANAVAWGNVTGKPSTFAPASHTHSQYLTSHQSLANYYTKTDADSKFQAKGSYAAANHTHSQYLTSHQSLANYYTKTDADSKFQPKGSYAAANHTHSQYLTSHQSLANYYTKTDCDTKFQAKGSYAAASHTHSQYLTSHQSLADYYTKTDADSKFQAKGSYAAANHTHSQYLTSHQSLADYYTKTDADSKFQPKGSYAAASHTHSQYLTSHRELLVADFSSQSSQSHRFPAGSIKKDVRIILCGSPSGAPSLSESSLPAAMTNGYCVEVLNVLNNMYVTLNMPYMTFSNNAWIKGSSKRIIPGVLYRFICYKGALWEMIN